MLLKILFDSAYNLAYKTTIMDDTNNRESVLIKTIVRAYASMHVFICVYMYTCFALINTSVMTDQCCHYINLFIGYQNAYHSAFIFGIFWFLSIRVSTLK